VRNRVGALVRYSMSYAGLRHAANDIRIGSLHVTEIFQSLFERIR